jgi:PKD domain
MFMKSSQTNLSAIVTFFWLTGSTIVAQTCEALFTFDNTNLTIHFTDVSTHAPNDPIVSWDWDFDDGGTSTQQNPVHTFPEPDRYDVVLTIETQNGCTSMLEIRIEICDFDVNYTLGACDPQGMIPVMLDITDLFDNANEISVTLDGQNVPGSPFLISGQNPVNIEVLVPGNGLSHTIMVQSLDIETCARSVSFTTEDCTSDCFLSSLQVGYVPGVTHDVIVDDNFFSPGRWCDSTGLVAGTAPLRMQQAVLTVGIPASLAQDPHLMWRFEIQVRIIITVFRMADKEVWA